MPVGEQVITIFLGASGLLDSVPVNGVGKFAAEFVTRLSKSILNMQMKSPAPANSVTSLSGR